MEFQNGLVRLYRCKSGGFLTYHLSTMTVAPAVPEWVYSLVLLFNCLSRIMRKANGLIFRIIEEEIESAIESRNESLPSLRELGPPDLVHLVKRSVKSGGQQVRTHTMQSCLGPCANEAAEWSIPPCHRHRRLFLS